jgi:hypothetical protein
LIGIPGNAAVGNDRGMIHLVIRALAKAEADKRGHEKKDQPRHTAWCVCKLGDNLRDSKGEG